MGGTMAGGSGTHGPAHAGAATRVPRLRLLRRIRVDRNEPNRRPTPLPGLPARPGAQADADRHRRRRGLPLLRHHPRVRAAIIAPIAVLTLAACTPDEIAFWQQRLEQQPPGERCPLIAAMREVAGLPEHFDDIAWRESRCDTEAISGAGALGVWQIMPAWLPTLCGLGIACTEEELLEPWRNALAAAYVFTVQGWQAWEATA